MQLVQRATFDEAEVARGKKVIIRNVPDVPRKIRAYQGFCVAVLIVDIG